MVYSLLDWGNEKNDFILWGNGGINLTKM